MGFIKKNVFLFACVGIILAGGGIFAFSVVKQKSNLKELQQISFLCQGATELRSKVVYEAELKKLEEIYGQAKASQQAAVNRARQTSRRKLLSSQVFPKLKNPMDKDIRFQAFAGNYVDFIDDLMIELNAGKNLSAEETQTIRDDYLKDAEGTSSDDGEKDKQAVHIQLLINGARKEHADEISVYADRSAFCGYYNWKALPSSREEQYLLYDAWFTQVAAWVQQDVVKSIKQVNISANSVIDAPVKRLVSIGFGGGMFLSQPTRQETPPVNKIAGIQRPSGSELYLPAYVTENAKAPSGRYGVTDVAAQNTMTTPYTGNNCNDDIDVIHFDLVVIADSVRVNELINTLQSPKFELDDTTQAKNNERNQITVLQILIDPVNLQAEMDSGFYYGRADAKLFTITCEYFFFKSGYGSGDEKLVPQLVADVRAGLKPSPAPSRTTTGSRGRRAGRGATTTRPASSRSRAVPTMRKDKK